MQLLPYALTTDSRVAARLTIASPSASQTIQFQNFVNAATEFIEQKCGRRFLLSKYTNELYSFIDGIRQTVALKQAPVIRLPVTGSFTLGSPNVTLSAANVNIKAGMVIDPDPTNGIPSGTTVVSCTSTALVMSNNFTYPNNAALDFQINGLISCQYRSGIVSNPSWTNFIVDQFELVGEGKSGLVRVYGNIFGSNNFRATYWAGYFIDFTNAGDPTKHNLPSDLTDLCERLVVRMYLKRDNEATKSVGGMGSTTTWADLIDDVDKGVIAQYTRLLLS